MIPWCLSRENQKGLASGLFYPRRIRERSTKKYQALSTKGVRQISQLLIENYKFYILICVCVYSDSISKWKRKQMLKKSLLLYFFLLSPLLASSANNQKEIDLSEIFRSSTPVRVLYIPRQETGEELIARNMHQPELWSCSDWLKQERHGFSEEALSSHSLFPALKEAMALADFEVDVLTGFTISVCSPNVQKIISELDRDDQQNVQDTIFELRKNALRAKYFMANIIDVMRGTVNIEDTLKEFFLNKMIAQIHEVAKLKHKCVMKQSQQNSPSKQKKTSRSPCS
jgi:hypothetical protein